MGHAFHRLAIAVFLGMMTVASQAPARSGSGGFSAGTARYGFHNTGHIGSHHSGHVGFHRAGPIARFHGPRGLGKRVFGAEMRRHRHRAAVLGYPPGAWLGWPYAWWPSPTVMPEPEPPVVHPEVIIIKADGRGQVLPENPPDDSYVPGCHAIPNGYHCDPTVAAHARLRASPAQSAGPAPQKPAGR